MNMPNYYLIANEDQSGIDEPHSNEWPKIIAVSTENQFILLSEGSGHGLTGCNIPLSDFDSSDWIKLFKSTNSEWFLNFLKNTEVPIASNFLEDEIKKHRIIAKRQF